MTIHVSVNHTQQQQHAFLLWTCSRTHTSLIINNSQLPLWGCILAITFQSNIPIYTTFSYQNMDDTIEIIIKIKKHIWSSSNLVYITYHLHNKHQVAFHVVNIYIHKSNRYSIFLVQYRPEMKCSKQPTLVHSTLCVNHIGFYTFYMELSPLKLLSWPCISHTCRSTRFLARHFCMTKLHSIAFSCCLYLVSNVLVFKKISGTPSCIFHENVSLVLNKI